MKDSKELLKLLEKSKYIFDNTENSDDLVIPAKFALLESCGWIEECMDDMLKEFLERYLITEKNKKYFETKLSGIYGFDYDKHFRQILIQAFGIVLVDKIEAHVNNKLFADMKAALGNLRELRNKNAHRDSRSLGINKITSPHETIKLLTNVMKGLEHFEQTFHKILNFCLKPDKYPKSHRVRIRKYVRH